MNRPDTSDGFSARDVFLVIFAILAIFLFSYYSQAQTTQAPQTAAFSRWALGRPSLLVDMPGDPSGGGVAWAEKPLYSIFPNSWSAEGGGVRIEVARIYTGKFAG
jgi:hypothetical protein